MAGSAAAPRPRSPRLPVLHGVLVGIVAAALVSALALLGVFEQTDLRFHDWRYRIRGPIPASSRIALVEVDDATVSAYRNWPLPRETYALLIDALERAGAQAIGFDLLFLGDSPEGSGGDELLAAVTAHSERVVHAVAFLSDDPSLASGASEPSPDPTLLVRGGRPVSHQRLPLARRISLPYVALLHAASSLGHTAVSVDRDGVVRRIPLFVRYGDLAYPSLAIRLVEVAARRDSTLPQFELDDRGVRLHWHGRQLRVPADDEGATSIIYAGDRAAFPQTHSMLRVLQWARDGDTLALARAFRGRLVMVGATAVGEVATDVGPTPFATSAPLVYIHANAMNAAVQARFLQRPSPAVVIPALLLMGAGLGALFSAWPLLVSTLVALAALLFVGAADVLLFVARDVGLPSTAFLLVSPVAWIAVEGYRRVVTERQTRHRERELEVARGIQRKLLPAGPPSAAELDVFGVNVPAEAVGGDYYDWIPLGEDDLAIVVGDVSGHGVPAALLMSHLRASFHAEARPGLAPREIVQAMHRSLARATEPNRFATFFLAIASRRERRLRYCNAGHNPPLLVRRDGHELLQATGIPLAMIEDMTWDDAERPFEPGDTLVLYSDGVTEYPYRKEFYGDERWERMVLSVTATGAGAAQIGEALLGDVRAFARGRPAADDVTIVVVKRR